MAEMEDSFGSEGEEYEDALDELIAEEKELKSKAKVTNESVEVRSTEETELASTTEKLSLDNLKDSDKREVSSSDVSDDDESDAASCEPSKAYCDIPADPSEELKDDFEKLHERLNQEDTADSEEDKEDKIVDDEKKDEYFVDEEAMKKVETNMTDEEKTEKRDASQAVKAHGNEEFKAGEYQQAIVTYTEALRMCPLCFAKERAIMYSNRGACRYKKELYDMCIADCSLAVDLHPHYVKALLRRAECYEKTDKLEDALQDYTRLLEIDPSIHQAREACMRLPDQIKERNEKLKEEMMGKLKDLGNLVLKPFGLSTNSFNFVQNPDTGSYSVNFNQNGQ